MQTSRDVFSNFEIPMFFICFIVMNIICLFHTWQYLALIVNMIHIYFGLHSGLDFLSE